MDVEGSDEVGGEADLGALGMGWESGGGGRYDVPGPTLFLLLPLLITDRPAPKIQTHFSSLSPSLASSSSLLPSSAASYVTLLSPLAL